MPLPVRLLKLAGAVVLTIGIVGLISSVAPVVRGQATWRTSPQSELRGDWFGRSGLGASLRDVDEADVRRDKLPTSAGAVIEDVRADGPAARAGMRAGDVIITFDGERVRSARHLMRLAEETAPGREITATVLRAARQIDLKITPAAGGAFAALEPLRRELRSLTLPDSFAQLSPRIRRDWTGDAPVADTPAGRRLGVEIQDVSGQLASYFGTTAGALVTSVDAGSAAATAGLKAGDVITAMGGATIQDADELRRRLSEFAPETTMTVVRNRKEIALKVQFKDDPVEAETPRRIVK